MVLGSSDSFFHLWVANYMGSLHYQTYVIGDLPKQESAVFWQQLHHDTKINYPAFYHGVHPWPNFEDIYKYCGGNMFLMKKAHQYCIRKYILKSSHDEKISLNSFPYVVQERAKLRKALNPSCEIKIQSPFGIGNKLFLLVESKCAFVLYDTVCESVGKLAVDSLIQHNVLHLRPTKECSYDLPDQPENQGIVMPESVCGYVAMKYVEILDELSKKDKC